MARNFKIEVTDYFEHKSYHDQAGYKVEFQLLREERFIPDNEIEDAKKLTKEIAELTAARLSGTPNGSDIGAGISWSNKVHFEETDNGYLVYVNYPVGD